MNNLLSYCGLVDARISASEKDLPVLGKKFDVDVLLTNEVNSSTELKTSLLLTSREKTEVS